MCCLKLLAFQMKIVKGCLSFVLDVVFGRILFIRVVRRFINLLYII